MPWPTGFGPRDTTVFRTSVKTGEGLERLGEALARRESVITGPSGAGKSSLLNALQPGLKLRTGEISARIRRGANTTVSAVMVPLSNGGFLVDTPGFSEVGLWGLEPRELAHCFPEVPAAGGLLQVRRLQPHPRARLRRAWPPSTPEQSRRSVAELSDDAGESQERAKGLGVPAAQKEMREVRPLLTSPLTSYCSLRRLPRQPLQRCFTSSTRALERIGLLPGRKNRPYASAASPVCPPPRRHGRVRSPAVGR